MSHNEIEFFSQLLILPGLFIIGGAAVMVAAILRGGKTAELRHRERMAMIERGMTPPEPVFSEAGPQRAQGFKMTLGIMLCGLGLALFILIAFTAGEPGVATGVGGSFAAVGLAFIVSAVISKGELPPTRGSAHGSPSYDPGRRPPPPPAPPPMPPAD